MTTPTDSALPAPNASEKNEVTVGRGILCLQGEGVDFVGRCATGAHHSFSDWDNDQRWSECPVVPRDWVSRRVERDGPHWHLTIATKRELNGVKYPPEDKADNPTTDRERVCGFCRSFLDGNTERGRDWFVLGIGRAKAGSHGSFFLVCCYPKAAALRRRLGLPPKGFHISLGFRGSDAHACDKGARSLLLPQPRSMAGLRTTATELVEAARTAFWETTPRKYHQTKVLLDASEAIISLRNLRGNPISSKSFDLVSRLDTQYLILVRDILQMRCHFLGRKREFNSVVEKASLLLDVQKVLDETTKEAGDTSTMTSIALGYKGFALTMLKKWKEAYPYLLSSYELYHQRPHSKTTERTTTRTFPSTIRRQEEEDTIAVHIERRLMNCCKVLGYEQARSGYMARD